MKLNKKILIIAILLAIVCIALVFSALSNNNTDTPQQDNENKQEISNPGSNETNEEIVEIDSKEASYEEWLAASMVTAVSLNYSNFEIEEILLASETKLNSHAESEGVYIKVSISGEKFIIHSKPLAEERTEAGTIDIHSQNLGYATFDSVDIGSIDGKQYEKVEMDELNTLISQSILVSLYEHY